MTNWTKITESDVNQERKYLPKFVADRNPAMASNRTVKRQISCNILGAEIPSGTKATWNVTIL